MKPARPLASPVAYPEDNKLGERLKNLAGLLGQPLGIRVAAVQTESDFDPHDRQDSDLTAGLTEVSSALSAFQADIEARVGQITQQIEDTTSDYDREKLQERLAKLACGVAVN